LFIGNYCLPFDTNAHNFAARRSAPVGSLGQRWLRGEHIGSLTGRLMDATARSCRSRGAASTRFANASLPAGTITTARVVGPSSSTFRRDAAVTAAFAEGHDIIVLAGDQPQNGGLAIALMGEEGGALGSAGKIDEALDTPGLLAFELFDAKWVLTQHMEIARLLIPMASPSLIVHRFGYSAAATSLREPFRRRSRGYAINLSMRLSSAMGL
jgi:hypothetical protein